MKLTDKKKFETIFFYYLFVPCLFKMVHISDVPVEILTVILSYAVQYHMIINRTCRLWAAVVRELKPYSYLSCVYETAVVRRQRALVHWILKHTKSSNCNLLLRTYYAELITKHKLLKHMKKYQYECRNSMMGSVDDHILEIIIFHRDTDIMKALLKRYGDKKMYYIHACDGVPGLQWLQSLGMIAEIDILDHALGIVDNKMAIWVCENGYIPDPKWFQECYAELSPETLERLFAIGVRIQKIDEYTPAVLIPAIQKYHKF